MGFLNLDGLALTPEAGAVRRTAEAVSREILRPNAERVDREGAFPLENMRALGEAGLLGLLVPKELGGPGHSVHTAAVVTEILAKGCISTAMSYQMHQTALPMLCAMMNEEQRERLLLPIIRGKTFGAFAMSEPGSGNRIWHMDSHAREDGDFFIVDSQKSFVTSAGYADWYLVPCRSAPGCDHRDLSLFFVDGKDPGVKPVAKWDAMGLRGTSSSPIHFDVRVPRKNLIGRERTGMSYMLAYSFPIYLCGMAACYLGLGQAAYEAAVEHVAERVHSDTGRSLAHVETVQRSIAEMRTAIDQVRAMLLRYAQQADNAYVLFDEFNSSDMLDDIMRDNPNDPFFVEVASLKPAACEMAINVSSKALQLCGGRGYKRGHVVERIYRDARAGSLMGPSDDTTKVLIGTQILELPQPWI